MPENAAQEAEVDASSSQPLITNCKNHDDDDSPPSSPTSATQHTSPWPRSTQVYALTLVASLSGLLFGYDTGIISSTLVSITSSSLSTSILTTADKSLITASTSFFALLASPIAGFLADALGRKRVILLAALLFILGAILQAVAASVAALVAGRGIVGVAIGAASGITPLYIAELAPTTVRGRLVTVTCLFITAGQVVAYLIGYGLELKEAGWRWMVGLGAVPAAVQLALLVGLHMPETPRWLVMRGREEEARKVLQRVYGPGMEDVVNAVLAGVGEEVREELEVLERKGAGEKGSWVLLAGRFRELFMDGGSRRALVIACMLQGSQQLSGFNSVMYFSAPIFALMGFHHPTLPSLSVAMTNFVFTIFAFIFIDRAGRRRMLLATIPFMVIGLLLCAFAFHTVTVNPTISSHVGASSAPAAFLLVLALIIYVASYALGLGCVPWLQAELFPLSVRSAGSGIATATNWAANTLVGATFLPLLDAVSPSGAFALYAGVCAAVWVGVWRVYPETAGMSLEEVRGLLRKDWGVRRD